MYIFGSLVVAGFPSQFSKKSVIISGLFASFIAQLLCGPSQIFGLPEDSILMMCIGQALVGFTLALVIIPGLPEIIEVTERKFTNLSDQQKAQMADVSSGIINCSYGIGQGAGPIYAAFFAKRFGFRLTCDSVALTFLALGTLYLTSSKLAC